MPVLLSVDPPLLRLSDADPIARFAAAELVRYTVAAGGPPVTAVVVDALSAPPLPADCGWEVQLAPLRLQATDSRRLLAAVYHYLAACGWRWYLPGPLGEAFRPALNPPPERLREPAGAAERVLVDRAVNQGQPAWISELRMAVDWMAKRGFTTLALESEELQPARWQGLTAELARRGLRFEVGGDVVPLLLAATHRPERQSLRHERGRERARRLEVADALTVSALPETVRQTIAELSPAVALRLVEPGELPLASADEPSPQTGRRLTAVARAATLGLDRTQRLVVWSPVSDARRGFSAPDLACLVIGLDRRDLTLPVGSSADPRNAALPATIAAALDRPGGAEVALPHADPVLLGDLTGPLVQSIAADLEALRALGVQRYSLPCRGALSWWLYPLNLHLVASLLDDSSATVEAVLDDWCHGLFGAAAAAMRRYYGAYEAAMAPLWRLAAPQQDPGVAAWRRGGAAGEAVQAAVLAGIEQLPAVAEQLRLASATASDPLVAARLERERQRFELNHLHCQLRLLWVQSRLGHPTLALHAAARELVSQIHERLRRLHAATCGAALQEEYTAVLQSLAHWCGYREPLDATPAVSDA
ncbi:MAG: hypothetical protein IT204_18030 [Fimbriimonadaceae bacterium]|nr:hypothetical protein [Fimbriimonadaceae bacterium]